MKAESGRGRREGRERKGEKAHDELAGDEDNHRRLVGRSGLRVHGRDLVLDRREGEALQGKGCVSIAKGGKEGRRSHVNALRSSR